MGMVSYAQNCEDVLLNRIFPGGRGFYVDVGANDPVHDSVTKHFYDRGWRGINVEPVPAKFDRLVKARDRDINLNLGVSDRETTLTFFEELGPSSALSTFSAEQAEQLRRLGATLAERPVRVTTLASILERHVPPDQGIEFLKIDAECHELQVIRGADWSRWRPRVLLIEATGWPDWEEHVLCAGYLTAAFDGVNNYYVRGEDAHLREFLRAPANVSDDFIPYTFQRQIDALKSRLAAYEELGPLMLQTAGRVQRLSKRFPFAAAVVKRALRLAG